MIDDPEQARRLARAICSDIRLYNESELRGRAPAERTRVLADAVTEGYGLYLNRVSDAHRSIFEEAVIALHAELGAPYHGVRTPERAMAPVVTDAAPAVHPPVPAREPARSSAAPLLIALVLAAVALAAGAASFFLTRP